MSTVDIQSSLLGPWGALWALSGGPLWRPLSIFYPHFSALLASLGFILQLFHVVLDFQLPDNLKNHENHRTYLGFSMISTFVCFPIFHLPSTNFHQLCISKWSLDFSDCLSGGVLGPLWPALLTYLGRLFRSPNPSKPSLRVSWNQFQPPMTSKTTSTRNFHHKSHAILPITPIPPILPILLTHQIHPIHPPSNP